MSKAAEISERDALLERLHRIPIFSAMNFEIREIAAQEVTLFAPYRK